MLSHAADVDANNIIDALKPRPVEGQMRTRSMRNLQVEQLPPPSVSLTIQFDFDSSKVSASSASQLDQLAKALKSDESIKLTLDGQQAIVVGSNDFIKVTRKKTHLSIITI